MDYKNYFSQRYGYQDVEDIIIKDSLPIEVQNAIQNCIYALWSDYNDLYRGFDLNQKIIEKEIWVHFLNRSVLDFDLYTGYKLAAEDYINDPNILWYRKLDLIEFVLRYIKHINDQFRTNPIIVKNFVKRLNIEFSRLNYGYRVVGTEIVEVTSETDIATIKQAIEGSKDNVKEHISKALAHYGNRPDSDVRNSIKESISAVETICRELTGESTLGKALKKLESRGVNIHPILNDSFTKLYAYTNNPDTGIRHALMDDSGTYVPSKSEAYLMLVTCSAFINYLRMKLAE